MQIMYATAPVAVRPDLPAADQKPAPHLTRGGNRFPAGAKPLARVVVRRDASAGEGRMKKDHAPRRS